MQISPFDKVAFDGARFEADLALRPASHSCAILFTPRSGSSWLTDILTATRVLGRPIEWFNPNFLPNIAQRMNADSLDRYVAMLRRKGQTRGLFSFEITIYQMHRVFGTEAAFLRHFPAAGTFYYLRREDIVLQAVSLAKAVATQVFHAARTPAEAVVRADAEFAYDAEAIEAQLDHILDQERLCEIFFTRHDIRPRRLSYEQNVAAGAEAVVARFLRELRNHPPPTLPLPLPTAHVKIGTDRNSDFAGRFRRDRPETMLRLARLRPPLRPDEAPAPAPPLRRRRPAG